MCPYNENVACTHALPKIHKEYANKFTKVSFNHWYNIVMLQ